MMPNKESLSITNSTLNDTSETSERPKTLDSKSNSGQADSERLVLVHDNGDKKEVIVTYADYKQIWKVGKKLLVIKWGDLAGEYALNLEDNNLYEFGEGGGLRRRPTRWHALDHRQAWAIWYRMTAPGRKVNERFGYGIKR